jgi:hypothetical protein
VAEHAVARPVATWWPAPVGGVELAPFTVAAGLAVAATALRWRGGDLPAQLLRAHLFDVHGFTPWNGQWFGGHSTAGYSVLFPALASWFGTAAVGIASAAVTAVCAGSVARRLARSRARPAATWFAAGTVVNLAVGRLTFALGLALASCCVAALVHGRTAAALVLAPLTPLASPVAAVCLAIVLAAGALGATSAPVPRRRLWLAVAVAGIVPLAVLAWLFPDSGSGSFPYKPAALASSLVVCGLVCWMAPASARPVRVGALLYGAASVLAFAVPNPLGGNLTRLGMFAAGPVLVAVTPHRRRHLLWLLAPLLLWWQWSPALDAILRAGADASSTAAYHQPLIDFVIGTGATGRIEIVPTMRHWETFYVASELPLARGWERQTDRRLNALFYEGTLTAAAYHEWLVDNAVRWVALPDVELDGAGLAEAALLSSPPPYLTPVWSDGHWRVWAVDGSGAVVSGSGRLLSWDTSSLVVAVEAAGTLGVRVHDSPNWRIVGGSAAPGACIAESHSAWLEIDAAERGTLVIAQGLFGAAGRCPVAPRAGARP